MSTLQIQKTFKNLSLVKKVFWNFYCNWENISIQKFSKFQFSVLNRLVDLLANENRWNLDQIRPNEREVLKHHILFPPNRLANNRASSRNKKPTVVQSCSYCIPLCFNTCNLKSYAWYRHPLTSSRHDKISIALHLTWWFILLTV